MRHCTFPVPKILGSGGVGKSWEWVTQVKPYESWKYDAVGKPLWSRAEGHIYLDDLGDGGRACASSRATRRSTRGCAGIGIERWVHEKISSDNDPSSPPSTPASSSIVTARRRPLGRIAVRCRRPGRPGPGGTAGMAGEWGPLEALTGDWESDKGGLDAAFSHSRGEVLQTPYLEKLTIKPFGPVDNGSQHLYGLDYKSAMWRGDEENPFHTEVGYWLWDGATGEVMRGFVVPRGITVLAGGTAAADARRSRCTARPGDPQYSIGENKYLRRERVDAQLRRHHHHQRRRQLVVRRDDDAEDGRVPRAVRAHRPQHPAQGRLNRRRRARHRSDRARRARARRRDARRVRCPPDAPAREAGVAGARLRGARVPGALQPRRQPRHPRRGGTRAAGGVAARRRHGRRARLRLLG